MHDYSRITEAHTVNIATFLLLLENWPLFDADTDLELVGGDVLQTQISEEWLTILG